MAVSDPYPGKLLLTVKEVMAVLSMHKTTFYALLSDDPRFPAAVKVGKGSRWRKADVYAYIDLLRP